jgi:hypothetical protein
MDVISTNVKHAEFKNQKMSKENLLIVCSTGTCEQIKIEAKTYALMLML